MKKPYKNKLMVSVIAIWATAMLLQAEAARAETPISIELVLAVDTSLSVNDVEYDLQMKGIARAFRNPEIINLIGQQDGVAVTLFQWSAEIDSQYAITWHLLRDPASVLAFAAKVENAERDPFRLYTGIGGAIDFGVRLITENAFAGRQLKIDVSGDGRDNTGSVHSLSQSRQRADALGITINGLPILISTYGLDTYYRDKVISGQDAFLEIAIDYGSFAHAFLRKLRREIAPRISRNNPAPRAGIQRARADPPPGR